MNKQIPAYRNGLRLLCSLVLLLGVSRANAQESGGYLLVHFTHTANGRPLYLYDSTYINAFGESYSLRKLKYYISHFEIPGSRQPAETDPYHLIELSKDSRPIMLRCDTGSFQSLRLMIGIDSAANCSGAQSGALDPVQDMFWTWNSGYVIFKMEGESDSSRADLNRIEHHIGGYKGENNVSAVLTLFSPASSPILIRKDKTTHVFIETNLDYYWKGKSDIHLRETSLCTTAGATAKTIAANLPGLFSIQRIVYDP